MGLNAMPWKSMLDNGGGVEWSERALGMLSQRSVVNMREEGFCRWDAGAGQEGGVKGRCRGRRLQGHTANMSYSSSFIISSTICQVTKCIQ